MTRSLGQHVFFSYMLQRTLYHVAMYVGLTKIAKESLEASQKFPLAKQYEKRDRTYLQAQKRDEMDGDCVEPGSLRDKLFESMGLSPRPLPSPRIRKRGMKARAKNQAVPIYQTSTKGSGDEV